MKKGKWYGIESGGREQKWGETSRLLKLHAGHEIMGLTKKLLVMAMVKEIKEQSALPSP